MLFYYFHIICIIENLKLSINPNNYRMKTALTFLIVLFSLSMFGQYTRNFIDQNYIEVQGKGEIEISPDEIYIQITINEADYKGKESLEMLEKRMLEKLTAIGVDLKKDFYVTDISSNFKNYWLKKQDIFTSKQYQLVAHTAQMAGRVFRELESLGVSNMDIVKVDHSEIEKFKEEVKVKAILNAKKTADILTKAINHKASTALYIQESQPFYRSAPYAANMMKVRGAEAMDASYIEPEIEFEKIKLEYSVIVYFSIYKMAPSPGDK